MRKYSFATKTMGTVSDKKQTEILNQKSEIRMFTELAWLPEKFFVFFIQSVRCIFSLSVTLHSQFSCFRLKLLPRCCVFCQRFLNGGPTRSASLPNFLVHIRRRLFFRISAKKRQRIASSSSGGISSKRLASLRWSLHSLCSWRCLSFRFCF